MTTAWEPYIDRLNQLTEHDQSLILAALIGWGADQLAFLAELDHQLTSRGAPRRDPEPSHSG